MYKKTEQSIILIIQSLLYSSHGFEWLHKGYATWQSKAIFMAFSGLKHAGKHFIPLRKQKSAFCVKKSCIWQETVNIM